MSTEAKVKLHIRKKALPKISISNVDVSKEEIRESILSKNPNIRSLVEKGHSFELLFIHEVKNTSFRNAIFKVGPVIRNSIAENKFKVFVGLKNCSVYDRIHYKTCFNCQHISTVKGSHTSENCPIKSPVCRYCAQKHRSSDCGVKNEPNSHHCINCKNSDKHKQDAKSHIANANTCPLVIDLINSIISNTDYLGYETKNLNMPQGQLIQGANA